MSDPKNLNFNCFNHFPMSGRFSTSSSESPLHMTFSAAC
jgi:hypothetical protein